MKYLPSVQSSAVAGCRLARRPRGGAGVPTLVLGDGRHAVAAAEARHPLEPLLGVQGHDQNRDVHLAHIGGALVTRALNEGSRRFHNHEEGPYTSYSDAMLLLLTSSIFPRTSRSCSLVLTLLGGGVSSGPQFVTSRGSRAWLGQSGVSTRSRDPLSTNHSPPGAGGGAAAVEDAAGHQGRDTQPARQQPGLHQCSSLD